MKRGKTGSSNPVVRLDADKVAAAIAFHVARGDIPPCMLAPLLGRSLAAGETAETAALEIAGRIINGDVPLTFADNYQQSQLSVMRIQRGCREVPGSDLLLQLLLESCPKDINPRLKVESINKVLESFQGPCCQQSPCIRGQPIP